jgi:hypothetical protein
LAKSNKYNNYRKTVIKDKEEEQVKPEVEEIEEPKASEPDLVKIQLIVSLEKCVYTDKFGNRLVWSGAGSVNSVCREDADYLLSKQRVFSCCGGSPQRKPMFKEI